MNNRNLLLFFSNLLWVATSVKAQRESSYSYFPDIDQRVESNRILIRNNFRMIRQYSCPDSLFDQSRCMCLKEFTFDDSGKISSLIVGKDIDNQKTNYHISFITTTPDSAEVLVTFKNDYVNSHNLFQFDTIIHNKQGQFSVFVREQNGDIIMRNKQYFSDMDIPSRVKRFDKFNQLQVIDYPLGNRKPLKQWKDTVITEKYKTYNDHKIYKENEYHSFVTYNKSGLFTENGYINKTPDWPDEIQRKIYVYDDRSRVILKTTMDERNTFIAQEHFYYDNNTTLRKYIFTYDPDEKNFSIFREYDVNGNLLELIQRSNDGSLMSWKYYYQNDLQIRTDFFENNVYSGSTLFQYR